MLSLVLTLPLVFLHRALIGQTADTSQDLMRSHYEAANQFLASNSPEDAALEYKSFLSEALHRVANGEAQAGQFDASFPLFDQALSFAPDNNDLRLDFASAALDTDKLPQARALCEEAVRRNPRSVRAHFLLGRVLYNLEDYEHAKAQLEIAVVGNSDFPTGYLLGKTYLILHDEKSARTLFDEMVSGLGDTPLIHIYFGRAYSLMDYPEDAVAEFHKAMARDAQAHDAHYYLALAYLRHDETAGYAQAVPEFEAELRVNSSDVRSRYMLGYIALRQRKFPEAETHLSQALALQPQDLNALISLSEVYVAENRTADAEAVLRKAVTLAQGAEDSTRQSSRAHYLLGRLLMRSGHTDEAKHEMAAATSSKGAQTNSAPGGEARVINSGSLVQEESRTDRTAVKAAPPEELARLKDFKKQLSPLIGEACNNLGVMAANRSDFKAAAEYFEGAATWSPSSEVDRNLGMSAYYAGEYARASSPLRRYLASHPDDAVARTAYEEALKEVNARPR